MKIQLLKTDDWMGVYVDGELKHEGHSIADDSLLKLAGVETEVKWVMDETPWDEWGGRCPEKWPAELEESP